MPMYVPHLFIDLRQEDPEEPSRSYSRSSVATYSIDNEPSQSRSMYSSDVGVDYTDRGGSSIKLSSINVRSRAEDMSEEAQVCGFVAIGVFI